MGVDVDAENVNTSLLTKNENVSNIISNEPVVSNDVEESPDVNLIDLMPEVPVNQIEIPSHELPREMEVIKPSKEATPVLA